MALYPGSARSLTNATPIDTVLVDAAGDPVFGFNPSKPDTATLTNVVVSTTSAMLAAANVARRQLVLFNDSGRLVYVAFAATATITAYTMEMPNQTSWEQPKDGYTGDVSAIVGAGTGTVRVTEIV